MNVRHFIKRIEDIDNTIENVKRFDANRDSVELGVNDCIDIIRFLTDYKDSLLNREVVGKFDGV